MHVLRRTNRIVICLIILLALVSPTFSFAAEEVGLLRITKADYPAQVPRSYTFSVKLDVEYAFHGSFDVHAAIYEGAKATLDHPLWESGTEHLSEVGERTYDAELRSPSDEGQWILTGYMFVNNASGPIYFTDPDRGPGFIEIRIKVADNAKLTLQTPYGNVPVWVDGSAYSTDSSGTVTCEVGVMTEHTIAAPQNVSVATGWRVVFQSWNGTDLENPKVLLVTGDLVLSISFRDEFYLDVVTKVGSVAGAGWYQSGQVANFSAPSHAPYTGWESVFGAEYRFAGWSGDVQSVAAGESIVMDRPHRVVANYTTTTDYLPLVLFLVLAAAVAVAVAAAVLLRRRMRPPPPAPTTTSTDEAEAQTPGTRSFCIFCGAEIDPDAKFCNKCGRSLVNSD